MTLSRDDILARKIHGYTEPFPIGDDNVIIRGLTRAETGQVREAGSIDAGDHVLISCGLVEPKMTPEDVAAWFDNDEAGVLTKLSNRISELSGMVEGAEKSRNARSRKR